MSQIKAKRKKLSAGDKAFNVFNYLLFGVFTLICIYPFYYMIINTISANNLSASGAINFLPQGVHLSNYKALLELNGLGSAALVSIGKTVIGTALTVMATAFLGFMFTQERMWKRKFWYRFVVITMYFNAGLIPMFITMKNLNLTNTFWVYVIPTIIQPFNIILVKTYVESLPRALQEAAEIDGCGKIGILFRILVPVVKPALMTASIFAFYWIWQDFFQPLIFMNTTEKFTLSLALNLFLDPNTYNNYGALFAMSLLSLIPALVIFIIFQSYLVEGIAMDGIKG